MAQGIGYVVPGAVSLGSMRILLESPTDPDILVDLGGANSVSVVEDRSIEETLIHNLEKQVTVTSGNQCKFKFEWQEYDFLRDALLRSELWTKTVVAGGAVAGYEKKFYVFDDQPLILPVKNANNTAVTVNSVKDKTGVTTFTVTTDYLVSLTTDGTGRTKIERVLGGTIADADLPLIINIDYTKADAVKLEPKSSAVISGVNMIGINVDGNGKETRYYFSNMKGLTNFEFNHPSDHEAGERVSVAIEMTGTYYKESEKETVRHA